MDDALDALWTLVIEAIREQATSIERERCASVAFDERVDADATGDSGDEAYNRACCDIGTRIRSGK